MLGIIKRHFAHTSRKCLVTLYKSPVYITLRIRQQRMVSKKRCW